MLRCKVLLASMGGGGELHGWSGRRCLSFVSRAMGGGKSELAAANDRRNRSRRGRKPLPTGAAKEEEETKRKESMHGAEAESSFNLYELQGAETEAAAADMLEEAIFDSSATEMDVDQCYPQAERDVSYLDFEATGVVLADPDAALLEEERRERERKEPSAKMRELIQRYNPKERDTPRRKYPYVSRDVTKCRGCGVTLQSKREDELGFVPKPKTRKKLRVCRRCWYLQHHNREPPLKEKHQREVLQKDSNTAQLLASRNSTERMDEEEKECSGGVSSVLGEENDFATAMLDQELRGAVQRDVREFLSSLLPQRMCLVVHVVDLSDVAPESFLNDLQSTIGDNEVLVIGNKADLLPSGTSNQRLREWLRASAKHYCNLKELPLKNVQLVSSLRGNVRTAVNVMEELRKHRDVFVVGSVNSGKSTFINSVLMQLGIGGIRYNKKYGLTTSPVPGTTLDTISLPLKSGGFLHDTPGLQLHNALPALHHEERKLVLPRKQMKPQIFQLREGKSIFLGGLGRVDYIFGPPMFLSVCASHMLPIHPCDLSEADNVMDHRLGKDLCPPLLPRGTEEELNMKKEIHGEERGEKDIAEYKERLWNLLGRGRTAQLPPLTWKEFVFEKGSRKSNEAFADIVLPGVGWISVTGASTVPIVFHAGVMHGSGPYVRTPLMPFEARAAARKAYGLTKHGKLSDYVPPFVKHPSLLQRTLHRSPFLRERIAKNLPLASPAAAHPDGISEAADASQATRKPNAQRGRVKAAASFGAASEVDALFKDFDERPPVARGSGEV